MLEHEKIVLVLKDWKLSSAMSFLFNLFEETGIAGQHSDTHWTEVIESILKGNWWTDW